MFGRADLAQKNHAHLDDLKQDDPEGYDHVLDLQKVRGHAIDYAPGPAWIVETTARTGDHGRVFTARVEIPLPAAKP
ncbi:MAG: hypothetical protein ACKO3G_06150 [Planctomycetaceae bacterium]